VWTICPGSGVASRTWWGVAV